MPCRWRERSCTCSRTPGDTQAGIRCRSGHGPCAAWRAAPGWRRRAAARGGAGGGEPGAIVWSSASSIAGPGYRRRSSSASSSRSIAPARLEANTAARGWAWRSRVALPRPTKARCTSSRCRGRAPRSRTALQQPTRVGHVSTPSAAEPPPPPRVLVVDDEPQIVRALKVVLREAGFQAVPAETASEALDLAAVRPPEAAIIDLVLPDLDGIELTRRLREWSEMPILVLSAVGEEEQKVRALVAGADDYITKPFGTRELVARLQAALRRAARVEEEPSIVVEDLEVDLAARVVRRGGEPVHL